jgi:hypothetical protein
MKPALAKMTMLLFSTILSIITASPPVESAPVEAAPSEVEPADEDDPDEGGVQITAFVDVAYIFNSNLPANHIYRGAYTTSRTNEIALNLVGIWLRRDPDERLPFWVHVGLHAGASADAVYGAEPTPGGADSRFSGVDVFKHVSLANAGVKLKSGTDLGGGVFLSPIGFGSMFTKDTWLYTNAWESNATPYYLMGARIGQDLPAGFRVEGWVVNGFQTIGDGNGAPSYMVSLYWARNNLSITEHVFFGPEQARMQPRGWLVHSDTQLVWNTPRVGVAALWDVGQERSLDSSNPGVSVWTGGQASLRVAAVLHDQLRLDFVARPEMWWDNPGRLSGNDGFLVSGTGGMALWAFDDSIGVRLEYRYDWTSDANGYFYRHGATNPDAIGLARDQHNVVLALVGKFDYQLPRLKR